LLFFSRLAVFLQIPAALSSMLKLEIYAVDVNWYQYGSVMATQGTMHAEGSKLSKGEILKFE